MSWLLKKGQKIRWPHLIYIKSRKIYCWVHAIERFYRPIKQAFWLKMSTKPLKLSQWQDLGDAVNSWLMYTMYEYFIRTNTIVQAFCKWISNERFVYVIGKVHQNIFHTRLFSWTWLTCCWKCCMSFSNVYFMLIIVIVSAVNYGTIGGMFHAFL